MPARGLPGARVPGRAGPDRAASAPGGPAGASEGKGAARGRPDPDRRLHGAPGARAAVYFRVSTSAQSLDNQRKAVFRLVAARGYELVETFEEKSSSARERTAFAAAKFGARRGEYDVLVVWALDRFGRSMAKNLIDVLELDRLGVEIVSVCEPWLDTRGPVRDLLVAIFSWVAEQERMRLGERTRAGLERARREGRKLGRPPARVNLAEANRLRATGMTWAKIARHMGVKQSTLERARRAARALQKG